MGRFQSNKIILNKKGNYCSINKMNIFDSYNDYQIEIVYYKYTYKKHIILEINKYRYYGGKNGGKICIIYNGEEYMLKFPNINEK